MAPRCGAGAARLSGVPQLRIDRVDDELTHAPLVQACVRLLGRAQHVGVLASQPGARVLDRLLLQEALHGLDAAGVAQSSLEALAAVRAPGDLLAVVQAADNLLERSPVPVRTHPVALEVLGAALLSLLIDADASGVGPASGVVAQRLHQVALTTADLASSYDDEGTRRWFGRPRRALDGTSPAQALAGGFEVDGESVRQVRSMAAALTGLGAT